MTTPTRAERKKAELRREIIDTAFDCFATTGYHDTGIADIAGRLGIGHGTFYRYFANKRDIIDHVITDLIERIAATLTAENAPDAVDTLDGYRRQVARIGDALIALLVEDPRIPRVLLLQAPSVDAEMSQRILGFFDVVAGMTAVYLAHGVRLGYLRADLDIDNTARAINGMVLAAVFHDLHHPDARTNRQPLSAAIQRLLYDGITAREQ